MLRGDYPALYQVLEAFEQTQREVPSESRTESVESYFRLYTTLKELVSYLPTYMPQFPPVRVFTAPELVGRVFPPRLTFRTHQTGATSEVGAE